MLALSKEEATLTVTHGDLQTICGDHVRRFRDRPMVIDWGFYPAGALLHRFGGLLHPPGVFALLGSPAPPGERPQPGQLPERWQAASVYPGFIYLYPALMQYLRGDDSRLESS